MINGVSLESSVPDYRLVSVIEPNWYLSSFQNITLNITNLRRIHAFFFLVASYFQIMLLKEPVRIRSASVRMTEFLPIIYCLTVTLPAPLLVGPKIFPGQVAVKPLEPCGGRREPAVPPAATSGHSALKNGGILVRAIYGPAGACAVSSGLRAHCFCSLRWTNCSLHRTYLFSSSSNHYYLFPVPLEKMDFWHPARLHYWIPLPVSEWNHDKGRRFYRKGKKNCRKNVEENLTVGKKQVA